jgi:hypothetical protein
MKQKKPTPILGNDRGNQAAPWLRVLPLLAAAFSLGSVTLMVILGGSATPGYSHLSQFISELGARGALYESPIRWLGFLPAGISLLVFCGSAYALLVPRSRLTNFAILGLAIFAAGYLVAAAFPCDPGCRPARPSISQVIHNVAGLAGYLLAPAFLLAFALAARAWPAGRWMVNVGYVAAAMAVVGFLTLGPTSPIAGLGQRLLELAVLGWAVACGCYLAKAGRA